MKEVIVTVAIKKDSLSVTVSFRASKVVPP